MEFDQFSLKCFDSDTCIEVTMAWNKYLSYNMYV